MASYPNRDPMEKYLDRIASKFGAENGLVRANYLSV